MPIFYDPINLATNQLEQARIENLGTDPGTGVSGQIYYNTVSNKLKFYDGSAWANIGGGSAANDFLTGLSFNTTDGVLTATVQNQSNVTVDLDGRYALTGDVGNGTLTVQGTGALGGIGTFTANQAGNTTISVTHDSFSDSQTTAASTLTFGGTFQAYTDVTSNSTGHVTGHELTTFTLPAAPTDVDNYVDSVAFSTANGVLTLGRTGALVDLTVDLDGRYIESFTLTGDSGTDQTIVSGNTLDIAGGTNITTVVGATDTVTIDLDDSVTLAGQLTVSGTGQNAFTGQVTIPTTPSAGTDAASKSYVDTTLAGSGALIFQGGYDATTTPPSTGVLKGWTYVVTVAGNASGFWTVPLEIGDLIISNQDAPVDDGDWTEVNKNVDLASLTQVGIGNVNASAADELDGLSVAYSSGTATIGLDVPSLTDLSVTPASGDSLIIYDTSASQNKEITVSNLLSGVNGDNTFADTISATATVTHNLGTKDVIVQLYDTVTDLTVYARVDRASINTVTVTFGTTPANNVRVLIQKIG
jgi:hypothetical protein